jgi:hypothetical protein
MDLKKLINERVTHTRLGDGEILLKIISLDLLILTTMKF